MHILFEKVSNLCAQKKRKKAIRGLGFKEVAPENKLQRRKKLPAIEELLKKRKSPRLLQTAQPKNQSAENCVRSLAEGIGNASAIAPSVVVSCANS